MIEDVVSDTWLQRHKLPRPTAPGLYESDTAWIRVDCARRITHAASKDPSLLSWMLAKGQVEPQAEWYGKVYLDWRSAHYAKAEAARYSDAGCGDPDAWGKEDRYCKLLRALKASQVLRYVNIVVASRPLDRDLDAFVDDPSPFVDAVEWLMAAMHRINEDADAALEASKKACA
ncbi:hypothetical protein TA3x_000452 [Tundrisphaera sp. TA3]|uniref:hypothetical protein n=1 Tax=Tundrisphaera sp. TA3 TaxID=3435775 RepID=UPI003EBD65EB